LHAYLQEIASDDKPDAPLFPRAFELRSGKKSGLSNKFYRVMTRARVVERRSNKKKGCGRNVARQSGGLGFHCLRLYCTTALKASGASDVVAREIIGHESAAVSRTYSHIDAATLRAAIDKLPDLKRMSLEKFKPSAAFMRAFWEEQKIPKTHLTRETSRFRTSRAKCMAQESTQQLIATHIEIFFVGKALGIRLRYLSRMQTHTANDVYTLLPVFIRMPRYGQKCPHTGLSRSSLDLLTRPQLANNFRPPVKSRLMRQTGTSGRTIRLIDFEIWFAT
jgi:hypothetical protein